MILPPRPRAIKKVSFADQKKWADQRQSGGCAKTGGKRAADLFDATTGIRPIRRLFRRRFLKPPHGARLAADERISNTHEHKKPFDEQASPRCRNHHLLLTRQLLLLPSAPHSGVSKSSSGCHSLISVELGRRVGLVSPTSFGAIS